MHPRSSGSALVSVVLRLLLALSAPAVLLAAYVPPAAQAAQAQGVLRGYAFVDGDRDGKAAAEDAPGVGLEVRLEGPAGLKQRTTTDPIGAFFFDGLAPGWYKLLFTVPEGHDPTSERAYVLELKAGQEIKGLGFGIAPAEAAVPAATAEPAPAEPTLVVVQGAAPSVASDSAPLLTEAPTTVAPHAAPTPGLGVVRGYAFVDPDQNGRAVVTDAAGVDVEVRLEGPGGLKKQTVTDPIGAFFFDGLAPGWYKLLFTAPEGQRPTTDQEYILEIKGTEEVGPFGFGFVPEGAPVPTEDELRAAIEAEESATVTEASAEAAQRWAAIAPVSKLELRFAAGRDTVAQVQRRVLNGGWLWLGIPFISQLDGGDFQFVNCGPASLAMVLAGFGVDVGPTHVRDYLNWMIDSYDLHAGTSLDALAKIGREAGLIAMDLYSDRGGYRTWSTEAIRWHVENGHPVITLMKYRLLPGHGQSLSDFDHYIVITGTTPTGFIYNDGAFATTLGYGLEISAAELEASWAATSIPHHAVAFGLPGNSGPLSFPEKPRPAPVAEETPTPAPTVASLSMAAHLRTGDLVAPTQASTAQPSTAHLEPATPPGATAAIDGMLEREVGAPVDEALRAATVGEQAVPDETVHLAPQSTTDAETLPAPVSWVEPTSEVIFESEPGPRRMAPQLLVLLGAFWAVALAWSVGTSVARGVVRTLRTARPALTALISALRAG